MNLKNTLPKLAAVLLAIIGMASCQEDFNTIGADIIGDQNIDAILDNSQSVVAYSRKLLPVQTNELPAYQIGVYNDPVYGKSRVDFLSQFTLDVVDPNFFVYPRIDSVVLYMPFFSTEIAGDGDEVTYEVDSIFGGDPININIYESNYFLRDFDPDTGFEEVQKYYANQGEVFRGFLGDLIYRVEDFTPSDQPFILADTTTLAPGLRVKLPNEFFEQKIMDEGGTAALINNNNFRDHFRGLYFEVEEINDTGNLFLFDRDNSNLIIYYKYQTVNNPFASGSTDTIQRLAATVEMSMNAVSVNVYDNDLDPSIGAELFNSDVVNGEEKLYLRGGDGIITVIKLFGEDTDGDGVAEDLEFIREQKWLINEANLKFYVDKASVAGGSTEPERLVIFDITNGQLLADFNLDLTGANQPVDAITEHLGRLVRGSDDNGEYYKIRITHHLSNLINRDSTNVPLGLMVSQNVLETDFNDLENIQSPGIESIPSSCIVAPQGTVLYGNNTTNEAKKLILEIYYTKPE